MENISPFRKRCIIPVLGLIENSLYENSLVHNILCMLLQLINACPKLADILLDHGLLYVLFNTLSTLNGMENGYVATGGFIETPSWALGFWFSTINGITPFTGLFSGIPSRHTLSFSFFFPAASPSMTTSSWFAISSSCWWP